MSQALDEVLIRPGGSVRFEDRDDLLEKLDRLNQRVPGREVGRTVDHREHYQMLNYLRFVGRAGDGLLPLPVELLKPPQGQDPPDFHLRWDDGSSESFELTEGSSRKYQQQLTEAAKRGDGGLLLPVDINTPERRVIPMWVGSLFSAFERKASGLRRGRYSVDHLLIYDLTGLGLFVPLEDGAPLLRQEIEGWLKRENPQHRFRRISVLRDLALMLDVTGEGRLLRGGSPYFRLAGIRAQDEADLKRRQREIDRYCRENSIRHLKLFGSHLGDRMKWGDDRTSDGLQEDSDVDLLVEFEPGSRVTLFDMSRMERELGELIGRRVDLRTAADLSRYFRQEVVEEAVELHA